MSILFMEKAMDSMTFEEISELAHVIWIKEGRPEGQSIEHWLCAESALLEFNFHFEPLDISCFQLSE